MTNMHLLQELDLNLLVVFDVLLATQSTTEAARQLGRTQSAVSHALARLRTLFGDPLFVRAGSGLLPTPRALAVQKDVHDLVLAASAILRSAPFDPATLEARWTISTTDFTEALLLPGLLPVLAERAPRMSIDIVSSGDDFEQELQSGAITLGIGASERVLSGVVATTLWREGFSALCSPRHPLAATPDLDTYCKARHVLVSPRGRPGSRVDDALGELGRRRDVVLVTPRFVSAASLVARGDLVVTVPETFAAAMAEQLDLACVPAPVPLQPFPYRLVFGALWQADPAHRWLRSAVSEVLLARRASLEHDLS